MPKQSVSKRLKYMSVPAHPSQATYRRETGQRYKNYLPEKYYCCFFQKNTNLIVPQTPFIVHSHFSPPAPSFLPFLPLWALLPLWAFNSLSLYHHVPLSLCCFALTASISVTGLTAVTAPKAFTALTGFIDTTNQKS